MEHVYPIIVGNFVQESGVKKRELFAAMILAGRDVTPEEAMRLADQLLLVFEGVIEPVKAIKTSKPRKKKK
jgi:hypothetical protein